MITIPLQLSLTTSGYATADAAIAAAKRDPLQPKARQDAAAFAGRTFVDAWTDGHRWVLAFSGQLWLRVFADATGVGWAVKHEPPDVPAVAGPVVYELPNGQLPRVDPATLAADRRGAAFWQFWVNDMGFHVYLRRKLILCFTPARRRDTGEFLPYLWEDD